MTSMTCNDIDDMSDSISTAVKAYRCHSAGLLGCTMLAYRPSWGWPLFMPVATKGGTLAVALH